MDRRDQQQQIEEDLSLLTLRAALALAARMARRVQPILAFQAQGYEAYDTAISLAEAAAGDRWVEADRVARTMAAVSIEQARPQLSPPTVNDPRAHVWDVRQAVLEAARAGMTVQEITCGAQDREPDFVRAQESIVAAVAAAMSAAEAGATARSANTDDPTSVPAPTFAQRWGAEAQLAQEARTSDYERLRRLRPGTWDDLGRPIDPSEAGPIGPLWSKEPPQWYREGQQRLLPEVDIRIVPVEDGANAAEIFEREALSGAEADILSWDLVDEPEAVARLAATIAELYRLYRAHGRLPPTLLVFSRRISYEARETLMAAGATVFSNTGPWSGVSRNPDELREELRRVSPAGGETESGGEAS